VKCARAACDALHDESRVFINQDRHKNQESRKRGKTLETTQPWKEVRNFLRSCFPN
jgi:hypothetical protein